MNITVIFTFVVEELWKVLLKYIDRPSGPFRKTFTGVAWRVATASNNRVHNGKV